MELSGQKKKKFPYSSYILAGNFLSSKNIKTHSETISHIFPKYCSNISGENFPSSKNKNFLIFFEKTFFLYFGKWNFLASSFQNSYIFSKKKNFLYFKGELQKLKKQILVIFQEMELSRPKLKKPLHFF